MRESVLQENCDFETCIHLTVTTYRTLATENVYFAGPCFGDAWPHLRPGSLALPQLHGPPCLEGEKICTYGSVSAGREKWPFNVIFFLKVEPPCDQT